MNKQASLYTFFTVLVMLGSVVLLFSVSSRKYTDSTIVLHGASQFDHNHAYTKALKRFIELVESYYQGPVDVEFVLHANGELGTEKEFFAFMNIGAVVDFAVVAPSHASTFSEMVTIMDIPFLFEDADHYLQSIEADVFATAKQDVLDRADVLILGYGGGEKRHIFGSRPVRNMEELAGFDMRVMGSPIQSRMFQALGATPTVISSAEVYNAIQTGVIEGAENSAAVIDLLKWYEVAEDVSVTAVSYIVRPLFFNAKRFRTFPQELQDAILKAGEEAMAYERSIEMGQDDPTLIRLEEEGKINVHQFTERNKMLELAAPVKRTFAEEIGAESILEAINNLAPSNQNPN